jgi:hypothetical protein
MSNANIVDVLIENITTDHKLLKDAESTIEQAKDDKRDIVERLKDYKKDLLVLLKYANDQQKKKIDELGFDFEESKSGLNPVAQIALDIIMKAKDNTLSNFELYNKYVAYMFNKEGKTANYTEFNIKCRSLFNSQKLVRTKGKNSKSSKDDVISLNGSLKPPKEK